MPGGHKGSKAEQATALAREILKLLLEQTHFDAKSKDGIRLTEELNKVIAKAHTIIFGNSDTPPDEASVDAFVEAVFSQKLFEPLIQTIGSLSVESKKLVAQILCHCVKERTKVAELLSSEDSELVKVLVQKYTDSDPSTQLALGEILRQISHVSRITNSLLQHDIVDKLLKRIETETEFDVTTDILQTLQNLIIDNSTRCKKSILSYMEKHYEEFVSRLNMLVESKTYVTQRLALRLLAEFLVDPEYFPVMYRYVQNPSNLAIAMKLLKSEYAAVRKDAFDVFKVFVANPRKSQGVTLILQRNAQRLISFLRSFEVPGDKLDKDFGAEKELVIDEIARLATEDEEEDDDSDENDEDEEEEEDDDDDDSDDDDSDEDDEDDDVEEESN